MLTVNYFNSSISILLLAAGFMARPTYALQSEIQMSKESLGAAELLNAGRSYYEGTATALPNYPQAFRFFQQASLQDSSEAKAWLGSMYLRGLGTKTDIQQGISLIKESANTNNPIGIRWMGLMYQQGLGVPQDYEKAWSFYERAVLMKDPNSFGRLGLMYLFGSGIDKDVQTALELLKQGAVLGDTFSQVSLGRYFESEINVGQNKKPDYGLAIHYYSQAAARRNPSGAFYLGRLYEKGEGVPQDYSLAVKYYQDSARRGFPLAQEALGHFYEVGMGMDVNYINAYAFYTLAARQGSLSAVQHLQSLSHLTTPEQRLQAEAWVEQLHQRRLSSQSSK